MAGADRGLANNMLLYFATMVVAALLFAVLNGLFTDLMSFSEEQCVSAACATGATWINQTWDVILWVVLGLLTLMLIAAAIVEARRPPA